MTGIKEQLYTLCNDYITTRGAAIKQLIADAQEAGANETKSSAGDKYETGRELLQQEIDLNMARLNELNAQRAILDHIVPAHTSKVVIPGSLVYTSSGNFYIAIGAGKLLVDGVFFYAVSAASPVGSQLMGQQEGHAFELNGKKNLIVSVI
jgi:transcription elongation GreA/GreB family factor